MKYIVETPKSPEQATLDLEAAVKEQGFGVMHVYDLKQTLHEKGFELPDACRILEICNPKQALSVLSEEMSLNLALPCRVSVYQEAGRTKIGMLRPTALLKILSSSEKLETVAKEVERKIIKMVDAAV